MSIDGIHRDIAGHQRQIARLQRDKSREAGHIADAARKAAVAEQGAAKARDVSSAASKRREAGKYHDDAAKHQRQVAAIEAKSAAEQSRLGDAQRKLFSEQNKIASDQRRAEEARHRTRAEQERASSRRFDEQERATRAQEKRMVEFSGTLAQHAEQQAQTQAELQQLQLLPEKVNVLFLALSPRDQNQLQLDEEARSINESIRKSEHRDAIRLQSRWAVRTSDLFQAINEVQPSIVHFSGHGTEEEQLVFQNDLGQSKYVSKDAIVQLMAAAGNIQLVFFNTCYSRPQAEAVVCTVSAAIGMNTSIGDAAARIFSSQFYSAIGFGHSVAKAFEQAKGALMLEDIPEELTPELFLAAGVDGRDLVLVRPEIA